MSGQEVVLLIEEGLKNGRIKPHLAEYILAELSSNEPAVTDYEDSQQHSGEGLAH
jgi:hypothetical protein